MDLGTGGNPDVLDAIRDMPFLDSADVLVPDSRLGDGAMYDLHLDFPAEVPEGDGMQGSEAGVADGPGTADIGPPPPAPVVFVNGQAQGAMTGYGWVALGPRDTITSPTCGGSPITNGALCSGISTTWSRSDALCASGVIPVLQATGQQSDYDQDWGIAICVNVTVPAGGTLGQPYSTIKLSYTGVPSTGVLRLLVHRSGDDPTLPWTANYCRNIGSRPTQLSLVDLNTKCWDDSGTTLTLADVPNIDRVCLHVPPEFSLVTVDNLCLTGITFGY